MEFRLESISDWISFRRCPFRRYEPFQSYALAFKTMWRPGYLVLSVWRLQFTFLEKFLLKNKNSVVSIIIYYIIVVFRGNRSRTIGVGNGPGKYNNCSTHFDSLDIIISVWNKKTPPISILKSTYSKYYYYFIFYEWNARSDSGGAQWKFQSKQ